MEEGGCCFKEEGGEREREVESVCETEQTSEGEVRVGLHCRMLSSRLRRSI